MPIRDGVKKMLDRIRTTSSEQTKSQSFAKKTDTDNTSNCHPLCASRLRLVRTIGTGSYGRVYWTEVLDADGKPTGETVAVKRLNKHNLIKQRQVSHIKQEKTILAQMRHPFIVNLYNNFHDECYLYLVMEFVRGGEFFTYLRSMKRLESPAARFYTACVTSVFEYMHSLDFVFRDLKPENLLIADTGYLKLTDFGFAKHVPERTYTLCGTPEYVAPEVLLNKGHGKSVDWWTLGILIYEMVAGYTPYAEEDVLQIYQRILAGKILFPKGFDKDAKSLVKHLLQHDLSRRYGTLKGGASSVKNHRWLALIDFDELYRRELQPPYIPSMVGASENYHTYPETNERAQPVPAHDDPFADW